MSEIYDLAILGAGPAGISAAIYAARARLNTLWIGRKFAQGGQIVDFGLDVASGVSGVVVLHCGGVKCGWRGESGSVGGRGVSVAGVAQAFNRGCQIGRGVDAYCGAVGDAHFDFITVFKPTELFERLGQFER